MNYNHNCYKLQELNFNKGFLDQSVDITYIITMYDAYDRHKNIFNQLKKFVPTKKIIIVYNYGYKKCDKYKNDHRINIIYEDLTYTNMYIFNLARNYNNILILEDDFIFANIILNDKILKDVNNFIIKKKPNIYYLGMYPFIINVFDLSNTHIKCYIGAATHSVIYSKYSRKVLYTKFKKDHITHMDNEFFTNMDNKYYYYKPLCMQSFPETENQKSWHINKNLGGFMQKIKFFFVSISLEYNKILKLNEDGNLYKKYTKHYTIVKIAHILILCLIIYLVYKTLLHF